MILPLQFSPFSIRKFEFPTMKNPKPKSKSPIVIPLSLLLLLLALPLSAQSDDASAMADLKKSLKLPSNVVWFGPDPCNKWDRVSCDSTGRVTRIQLGNLAISGTLPPSLSNLANLQILELMYNKIAGPLPSLAGLSSLQTLNLMNNQFTSIPTDFFTGKSGLKFVYLDKNPFAEWSIPNSLQDASNLVNFSANSANLVGPLPEFIGPGAFVSLTNLHLTSNHLEGGLPANFSGLTLQSLWLSEQTFTNGTRSLGGSIAVLQNMTELIQVWLNMNSFIGPIPDLSKLDNLVDLNLRDNSLTGPVLESLTDLKSLKIVNLTNNCLQGPTPKFSDLVSPDVNNGINSFCLGTPGAPCDSRVDILISFLEPFGYPMEFAQNWKGNDPCNVWMGINCIDSNITVINLPDKGLSGSISASIARLTSVETLNLARNNITGAIPDELATMPNLKILDVSNNNLYGKVPSFSHAKVITTGNVNIGKEPPPSSGSPPGYSGLGASGTGSKSNIGKIFGIVVGVVVVAVVVGLAVLWCVRRRKKMVSSGYQWPNTVVIHPSHSESGDAVKITVASGAGNGLGASEGFSQANSGPSDVHVIEAGNNLVISIQVLRNVTNNFSENNVLGKGGFGTVYKGELHDGTKIAVKRMDPGALGDKGLAEFTAEIAVLTKVRHRNLVSLLGYCLDGNEKLLVYEYMPQGALSQHLFAQKECGSKPLEWKQRLTIALDVARGVEYLHNLAHQSFIHRDLKPSNILLGDDMRAKVSDFGLVRLAPNGGKASIQTKLAGTFGYLAPEYAVMGRITTKVDVYSFGVILMELITGRKALDETQPEESMHLVTWFKRMYTNKDALQKSVDPTIELNGETSASIHTIAELAGHCCARDPHQRPEMGHTVNVISSLVELWKPSTQDPEDCYGIDLEMSLPQALKKWQAVEGTSSIDDSGASSSFFGSADNTQSSIPLRPAVEASTFAR